MKLITYEDINELNIEADACYEWVSEMIENKNQSELPPKISLHPKEGAFCNVMPCILNKNDRNIGGIKVVNRYIEREPSLDSKLLLMDMNSGEYLAFMDANWITAMRTGAVAVHSIKYFAKKDFSTVAFMGLGNTARSTMIMLAEQYPQRTLKIKLLKYKNQEVLFEERFEKYKNLEFEYVNDCIELVKGSDVIISCATYLDEDVCPYEYFEEGVLVVPVHTRGFGNCDLFFDKVYADDYGHVCHFKYFDRFKQFAEVCDVVNGMAIGRENNKERIIVYNIGLAIHDINLATHIYDIIMSKKQLPDIDLKSPQEKFWV